MSDEPHFMPLLTVTNGPLRGASFRLRPGRHRIGREEGADILLDDPKVSRRHATVELVGGRVVLTDAGSTNGTWLNDSRLDGPVELRDGDRVRLGHVELRFFDPGSAPTEPVGTLGYRPLVARNRPAEPLPAQRRPGALARAAVVSSSGGPAPSSGAGAPSSAEPAPSSEVWAPASGALTAPTQLMGTPRRAHRRLAVVGGCLILLGWLAWIWIAR